MNHKKVQIVQYLNRKSKIALYFLISMHANYVQKKNVTLLMVKPHYFLLVHSQPVSKKYKDIFLQILDKFISSPLLPAGWLDTW